jgi:acetyl-CoA acetyltransferase
MPGSYIVAGARTPIGKMSGALAPFSAADLGGFAIKAALERAGVSPEEVGLQQQQDRKEPVRAHAGNLAEKPDKGCHESRPRGSAHARSAAVANISYAALAAIKSPAFPRTC